MDYVDNEITEVRHSVWVNQGRTENGLTLAKTWCGVELAGPSGACIAPMISCKRCLKGMRKQGWDV